MLENFQLENIALQTFLFQENHTAVNLAAELEKIISFWHLQGKVMCIVSDNAANIKAASDIISPKVSHIFCFAHTINLIVQRALEPVSDLRKECRKIVGYFKSSCSGKEKLFAMQTTVNKPIRKLVQEIETRWNSTFHMMERLLEQKECVAAALAAMDSKIEMLTTDELSIIQKLLPILKPFDIMTEELSSENHVSISKIIGLHRQIRLTLLSNQEEEDQLLSGIIRKFANVESVIPLTLATILDPRFKNLAFVSNSKADEAICILINQCSNIISVESYQQEYNPPTTETIDNELWLSFDKSVFEKNQRHNARVDATVEVQWYISEPYEPRSLNPFEYWQRNENKYSSLTKLARKYLCTPATSVSCGRLFSKSGLIVSKQRSRLKGDIVNMIIILNKNWE